MTSTTILIIEDAVASRRRLSAEAQARGRRVLSAATAAEGIRLAAGAPFEVAVVGLALDTDAGLAAIRAIRLHAPDTAILVVSPPTCLAAAIASCGADVFAFVAQPVALDQLFATLDRAIEHRAMLLTNRRLIWEGRLINQIGDEVRHLLAPEQLLRRVLRRLTLGMDVSAGAARLLNPQSGAHDLVVVTAPDDVRALWGGAPFPRATERVLTTRAAVRIDDLCDDPAGATAPLRSAVSVPMFAGDDLIGVLSVGSAIPGRFSQDDERMLGIIASQAAVGVQNARLHAVVQAGKQEWEATFDAISDPIAVFDRRGRLLRGNAALAASIGCAVTQLRGLSCDAIGLCGATFPSCAVGAAAAASACVHEEVTHPGDRIFSVTTCPVQDAADGAAIVQVAKDVTIGMRNARRLRQMSDELAATNGRLLATVERLRATQAQLLQAEKLSAIGQLVAGVAHELNNPLTSVIGYAQLLQEEVREATGAERAQLPDGLVHDLGRIAEESERAAKIVRNLLAFARRQSGARAEHDIADVVSRVLSLRGYAFRLNGIELETALEPGLPPILGDPGQLQQALLNLLLNAEQAMQATPIRRMRVGARRVPEADAVELLIGDTGHGIQQENLRRIFDPFFTTREVGEGTGLGLSICYGIVRDHGGQISVESHVGMGTTFKVLLPACGQDKPLRALVAHRDQTERDYVSAALTGWGHRVTAVDTAEEARLRLAAGGVDVALLDRALVGGDTPEWSAARHPGARPPALILMSDAGGSEGVAPPFELPTLRGALRAVCPECV